MFASAASKLNQKSFASGASRKLWAFQGGLPMEPLLKQCSKKGLFLIPQNAGFQAQSRCLLLKESKRPTHPRKILDALRQLEDLHTLDEWYYLVPWLTWFLRLAGSIHTKTKKVPALGVVILGAEAFGALGSVCSLYGGRNRSLAASRCFPGSVVGHSKGLSLKKTCDMLHITRLIAL